MITKLFSSLFRTAPAVVALLVLSVTPALHAGTPLICFPYEIGQAKSLPGGADGPKGTSAQYDRRNLVSETLALLTPEMPVIVRMETIRRAVVYATKGEFFAKSYQGEDKRLVTELLKALEARVVATGKAGQLGSPLPPEVKVLEARTAGAALFDLGFYSETLRQAGIDSSLNGYSLLERAVALRGPDAEMEFALALASSWPKTAQFSAHVAKARAGMAKNAMLRENVTSHLSGS